MRNGMASGLLPWVEYACWIAGALLLSVVLSQLCYSEYRRLNDIRSFRDAIGAANDYPSYPRAQSAQPQAVYAGVIQRFTPSRPVGDNVAVPANTTGGTAATVALPQPSGADPDVSLWSESRKLAFTKLAGHAPPPVLGILSIPSLNLSVPVYDGATESHLDRGVARIRGTAWPDEPGNLGIAGHRDGYFRVLKDIHPGDSLSLETDQGLQIYTVNQISVVNPEDVHVLKNSHGKSITLVTCYPFYFVGSAPQRYIVQATFNDVYSRQKELL